ncbi:MAG: hypothetical protein ACD_28C00221G0002 [uncultured bacterium]|nr:MAG: hypothetical protein ACD_28C00221G0002 [uncultured bacterium]
MLLPLTSGLTLSMPNIVIDSREQRPYSFGLPSVVTALPTGDYSLVGLESMAAIERKELSDLINCITFKRARFERELDRASSFRRFWVLIEGTIDQIERGKYRSKVSSESVLGSIAAWENRYNVRFVFAGNRQTGERTAKRLLIHAWKEIMKPSSRTIPEVV